MNDRLRESKLIARAVAGDGDAFAELIQPFEARVYNLAYRMSGSREVARDLAQEAFLKVFRALGRFKGQASFSTWLYRVVANTCLDQLRRERRSGAVASLDEPIETDTGDLRREPADTTFEPERLVLRSELEAEVRSAVTALPPDHRLAILLRDFEDLTYDEIAQVMDCSLGTVKSRISRARCALRNRLVQRELSPQAGVYSVSLARPGSDPPGTRPGQDRPGRPSAGAGSGPARGVDA